MRARGLLAAWMSAMILAACSDEGAQCPAGAALCGTTCVELASSAAHCGACGNACGASEVCLGARCAPACPVGQTRCGEACVDLSQDRAHCGRCGGACAAGEVCAGGLCDTDCGPLTTCADLAPGGAKTLYCANLALDRTNCGSCGAACPPGNVCRGGRCEVTCAAGQLTCNGRCVDPQTDRVHCGACGATCAVGFECARGRCAIGGCSAGTVLCAGACVDLQRDRAHCGACLAQCPSGYLCSGAECRFACAPGETQCPAGCADLSADGRNCGACGRACAFGELCQGGACTTVCQPGQTLCAGRCTDTGRDRAHCGACGRACPEGVACVEGACDDACPAGQSRCAGLCIDTASDPAHCGACGRACASAEACVAGACRAVATEPPAGECPAPSLPCAGRCTDVRNDNDHCGACGRACPGDQLCYSSACVRPCAAGQVRCATGACAALATDANNCGACANACAAGQFCVRGACTATPPPTRYTAQRDAPGVTFIDACAVPGATRVLAASDEGEQLLALPFPLRYWTTDYAAGAPVLLSVNGFFAFTGALSAVRSVVIPSTSLPNGVVSVHGRDLASVEPLCVATVGVAPLRRWVIEWSGSQERNPSPVPAVNALTFEAVITERADTIDFVYRRMDGAVNAYTGLEAPSGSVGQTGCTTTSSFCTVAAGSNVRFAPAP
jgi:hypothetical protein